MDKHEHKIVAAMNDALYRLDDKAFARLQSELFRYRAAKHWLGVGK